MLEAGTSQPQVLKRSGSETDIRLLTRGSVESSLEHSSEEAGHVLHVDEAVECTSHVRGGGDT